MYICNSYKTGFVRLVEKADTPEMDGDILSQVNGVPP